MKKLTLVILLALMCAMVASCNKDTENPAESGGETAQTTDNTPEENVMGSDNGGKFVFVKNEVIFGEGLVSNYEKRSGIYQYGRQYFVYEYGDDGRILKQIRRYAGEFNDDIADYTTYEYYPNGNVSKSMLYSQELDPNTGEISEVFSLAMASNYKYDKNNKLVKVKGTRYVEGSTYDFEENYEYDEKGNLIEYKNIKCKYDEKGNKISEAIMDPLDGKTIGFYSEFKYDEDGLLMEEVFADETRGKTNKYTFEYDDKKQIILEICTSVSKNEEGAEVTVVSKRTFDYYENGNRKNITEYYPNGNEKEFIEFYPSGMICHERTTYEDGFKSELYYNEDGSIKR